MSCEAEALRSCFPQLASRLQADDIIDDLYQASLLTQAQFDGLARDISQKTDLKGVNRRILIAVSNGSEGSVAKFAEILKKSQSDLAAVLLKALLETTRLPRSRSVSTSADTPTKEGVAVQGHHGNIVTMSMSVGKDEKVATLERQLQKAMSLIQEQSAHVEELTLQVEELKAKIEPEVFQTTPLLREGFALHSEELPDLPVPTACATAVLIKRKVYVCGGRCQDAELSRNVLVYHIDERVWNTLSVPAPQYKCQAVAISDQLVLIGGWAEGKITNLVSTWSGQRWEQVIPPMPTKRSRPGVLAHGTIVVVAGGRAEDTHTLLNSIDVLDTAMLQWWMPANVQLPQPMYTMTLTANSLYLHVAAASVDDPSSSYTKTPTKSVWRLPLSALVKGSTVEEHGRHQWEEIEPTPNFDSAVLHGTGHLVAIGGDDNSDEATTDVAMCIRNKWCIVGRLLKPRARCAIVSLSTSSILVCGGYSDTRNKSSLINSVELLNVCR